MPDLASMTGFARTAGSVDGIAWTWEVRSVNGRGLDVRLRLPPGCDAMEPALREAAGRVLRRGNVSATLTLQRETTTRLAPDPAALEQAVTLACALAARIPGAPPPRAEALLMLPGVLRPAAAEDLSAQADAFREGFMLALEGLATARREEGVRLGGVLAGLLAEIAALRATAVEHAAGQPAAHRARLVETLRDLLRDTQGLPEERIAQEVALLAARSDVREELDRLAGHIEAARALLAEGATVGRRLDFLVQEFNREANTLCSKSASLALTATGLALKAAIEQLREQVQNIE
jgi:uncharacterized protein (TIGR00255 family)